MSEKAPKIVVSTRSCTVVSGDIKVDVHIYRFEHSSDWSLQLVNKESNSVVWLEPFESEEAAWEEFEEGVREIGLENLLNPEEPTVH
ncbi:hypothetical protein LH464_14830 [Neorhizobium sp. T786]|uniref:hypothetical protein n=1 Tax=Pseudorhizobium xiangyangii TaxID=2883104 RepID=UPI001CFFCA35|nr:hypothetical protein [Neorhizobium xiangyangii]MCB5203747.1 hypothetical protein [Neorhizobium xiangyangii]